MNDYEMIQTVHRGIVYKDAPELLKKEADDFFDDPDLDGIYQHMIKIGLI